MLRFSVLLATSFAVAAIGCVAPWFIFRLTGSNPLTTNTFVLGAFVIGPVWAILASVCLWRYGKRGLWVLIGLPFALACATNYLLPFIGGAPLVTDAYKIYKRLPVASKQLITAHRDRNANMA